MADENYTIEVSAKIKGDLEQGLGKIAKYADKAATKTDKLEKELKGLDSKPLKDLQKASDLLGKSVSKLKPKPLVDLSKSATTLGKAIKDIKPKPILDVTKAAGTLDRTFKGLSKAQPFKKMSDSALKLKGALEKIGKSKPFEPIKNSAYKLKETFVKIGEAKPFIKIKESASKLGDTLSKIGKAKPFVGMTNSVKKLSKEFSKIKPKPFVAVGKAVDKVKKSFDKLKKNPMKKITDHAEKLRKTIGRISDQPIKRLTNATEKLRGSLSKIKTTPFKQIGLETDRANSKILNFIRSTMLMGSNLQGIVLLAVNRLKASFVALTDQIARVMSQMELWSGSLEQAVELTRGLQGIAVDTGYEIDQLSQVFTKLASGFDQYNLSSSQMLRLTRGLGLLFRQVGADGAGLAQVAGKIATTFTRDIVPFEKIESLLGEGGYQQILQSLAAELLKLKGIDISEWAYRGRNSLELIKQKMDENIITGKDLGQAWLNLLNDANLLSTRATEISYGWAQVTQSMKAFIGAVDQSTGFSNALAGVLTDVARAIRWLADNLQQMLKLGLTAFITFAVLNLPIIYGWIVKIGATIVGLVKSVVALSAAFAALKKIFTGGGLGGVGTIVKLAVTAVVTALVFFGEEMDKILNKYKDSIESFSPKLFKVLKAITTGLKKASKALDWVLNIEEKPKEEEKPKDEGKPKKPFRPPKTFDELVPKTVHPGDPGQKIDADAIAAQVKTRKEQTEAFRKAINTQLSKFRNVMDSLKIGLTSPPIAERDIKAILRELQRIANSNGSLLASNEGLKKEYEDVYKKVVTLAERNVELDPNELLEGVAGDITRIMKEVKGLKRWEKLGFVGKEGHITREDYDRQLADKYDELIRVTVAAGGEQFLLGHKGVPESREGNVQQLFSQAYKILKPHEDPTRRWTPLEKAVYALGEEIDKINIAYEQGTLGTVTKSADQVRAEKMSDIYTRSKGIQWNFAEELVDDINNAVKVDLQSIVDESAEFVEIPQTPYMKALERLIDDFENANLKLENGASTRKQYLKDLDNIHQANENLKLKNFAEYLEAAEEGGSIVNDLADDLSRGTQEAANYFKPLNTGVRELFGTFRDTVFADKKGWLAISKDEDKALKERAAHYVKINDSAREFRRLNARELDQNKGLASTIEWVILNTERWRKVLEKMPEPPKPQATGTTAALGLNITPTGEGLTNVTEQEAQMLNQAGGQAVNRLMTEGAQGRDLGPAGGIAQNFGANVASGMDPATAALIAALEALVEILVQAAEIANLFGEGLQQIFDPINKLITMIAKTISPIFQMLGNTFIFIGSILDAVMSILEPIFELIEAILKPFQAFFAIFQLFGQMMRKLGRVVGGLIRMALKPFIDGLTWVAETIIDIINWIIDAINKVKIFGTYEHVSLEGEPYKQPEEEPKCPGGEGGEGCPSSDKKTHDKMDITNKINTKQLDELKRANKALEDENRIRAQAAREIVRVKEIGSITEARQRGVISGQENNEPQPLINRIINVNSPEEIAPSRANERTFLNWMRENAGTNGGLPEVVNG